MGVKMRLVGKNTAWRNLLQMGGKRGISLATEGLGKGRYGRTGGSSTYFTWNDYVCIELKNQKDFGTPSCES